MLLSVNFSKLASETRRELLGVTGRCEDWLNSWADSVTTPFSCVYNEMGSDFVLTLV